MEWLVATMLLLDVSFDSCSPIDVRVEAEDVGIDGGRCTVAWLVYSMEYHMDDILETAQGYILDVPTYCMAHIQLMWGFYAGIFRIRLAVAKFWFDQDFSQYYSSLYKGNWAYGVLLSTT